MTFELGYSTYALKMMDPFEALPMIREVGYEALEIALGDDWPTAPHKFSSEKRGDLAWLTRDLGFPSPIFFGLIDVCAPEASRAAEREKTLAKFAMAHELHEGDSPILMTTTAGHSAPAWDTDKEQIRDRFVELADLAGEHNVLIAIEAHAGTDFETPEKAVWMMKQTQHPNLKLDLDISHFHVEGSAVGHSVDLCAPHAAMVHVKDGEKVDGKVQYSLPGAGSIDLTAFVASLKANNLEHLPVFAEVSVQQSGAPGYEPRATAEFTYAALDAARNAVG
ncbi:MAG: sugar phosphate isomerase/epimerase [Chloroflexi bacterium]|nr:sugar phosphate isomerase/epimerase [Chloroflexota bacterium]